MGNCEDKVIKVLEVNYMKRYIILISITITVMTLFGCAKTEEMDIKSENISREEQTLWHIIDNDGEIVKYLSEDDTNVKEIKEIVREHKDVVDNRSFDNLMYNEELELYSKEFKASLTDNNYEQSLEDMYIDNKIMLSSGNTNWYVTTFDEDLKYCKVTIDGEFRFEQGEENYLKELGLGLDTTYIQQRVIYFEKSVDNSWLISNITKSNIDKKDTM